jgi:hypothetical protein
MDLRLAEYITDFELQERWHAAARLHMRLSPPVSGRIAAVATASFGHLLVRAGTRLASLNDRCLAAEALSALNSDPCHGCAN